MKALFAITLTLTLLTQASFAEDKKVESPIKSTRKRITTRGATMGVRGLVKNGENEPIFHSTTGDTAPENKNLKKVDALEIPKEEIKKLQLELVSPREKH
jgi:hypothetical protein